MTLREIAETAYFRPDVRAARRRARPLRVGLPRPASDLRERLYRRGRGGGRGHRRGAASSRIVAVEDCGTMINPEIVDGQVRGAVAQGIGGALLERVVYDDDGQPQADHADGLPAAERDRGARDRGRSTASSPSPLTPGGIKGMGESGLIATPAAVANAVADALAPFGARVERLPLTPEPRLGCSDLLTTESEVPCTRSRRWSSPRPPAGEEPLHLHAQLRGQGRHPVRLLADPRRRAEHPRRRRLLGRGLPDADPRRRPADARRRAVPGRRSTSSRSRSTSRSRASPSTTSTRSCRRISTGITA